MKTQDLKASIAKNINALVEGEYAWGIAGIECTVGWISNMTSHTYEQRGRAIVALLEVCSYSHLRVIENEARFFVKQMHEEPRSFEQFEAGAA